LGFWLGLGAHFVPDDPRLEPLARAVLAAQFEDGGWNCQMRNHPDRKHSSFNMRVTSQRETYWSADQVGLALAPLSLLLSRNR
jgi:hypothetical protein